MSLATDRPRLLVTRRLPPAVEERARTLFEAELNPADTLWSAGELVERASRHRADALLICLTERLDAGTMSRLPGSLRVISTVSVGTNHIDLAAAQARGIAVGYAPDATTAATADLALLLLLSACRRAHEHQAILRSGQWGAWNAWNNLGMDPGGKVLGLVGMGRIGRAVAQRARAFGMRIAYHQRRRLSPELEDGAEFHSSLESLFRASRIVSLHTPSTPETLGQINAQSLSWLPEGAVLINTARGDQVVDDDLIAALRSGRLAAAGLDVFAGEPAFDRRYLDLPNATLLPHIGTSTVETRDRMGMDAIANLEEFFAGRPLRWPVG
ncbi:Glycerate dehydrogenase [Magnetospirillum sp. XM-1]|uniref:2-hydroxyacid dehydrogenase n=1 Tax=Magnetospirillum sp. XM-1 TaxID=1663591 RepID=UPI00073DF783|nr:D-glycerate dehydrogenase [Magnetospirillum sp. XM-1]CUW37923.1 Glycerate dehydrogenase [Magnetospirillum sp. XM-1]